MAKYNQGLLAQFSGKVGPVVGRSWKGIGYLRSNARKKKNRDVSVKTEIQRAKFKLASSFVKAIASLLAISFRTRKPRRWAETMLFQVYCKRRSRVIIPICELNTQGVHNYEKDRNG